ncbi:MULTISPECIES: tol-pal system-associated acyl-CoA thioesterase [unclassified Wenzhouxiangella]|uniref:tol-pal system-associated acyl-CoA thioesterase n=1 Tax=unclassified Wenzhouxiangella TaxID=2613841 RepID=UPI000E3274C9|nr:MULTISPECIES: tol-pal system-associated acyl-CoA thioesterase [unclassified Wenzhouxiangella]RFF28198.1 tol-pal system-associated acyl-CoA thioesterase [Wenzhouxiangella sp. 15181]RFP67934.1 tol-pal system-associated acyl-CoA thioesterase [Wenzhouxiangella sp. 15190]
MTEPFRYRVYWEDTDAGGVVYHARYLAFFERARSDWLRVMGFPQVPMRERDNRLFVVRRVDTRFIAPARLEDELEITIDVEHLRAASLTFHQHMARSGDGELLATARVDAACLAADRFVPARMPEALRTAIKRQQQKQESQ